LKSIGSTVVKRSGLVCGGVEAGGVCASCLLSKISMSLRTISGGTTMPLGPPSNSTKCTSRSVISSSAPRISVAILKPAPTEPR
jgi:hypothetical protein